MQITVETTIDAHIDTVWAAWTTPEDILAWNTASPDWRTTAAAVDLRPGGAFSSRIKARDGSMGFDFADHYTRIDRPALIGATIGDRSLRVESTATDTGTNVRETFYADDEYPADMLRAGWQAILDSFKRHVEAKA